MAPEIGGFFRMINDLDTAGSTLERGFQNFGEGMAT